MVLPLVYFPIGWVDSFGMNGVGLLYFFIFAAIIIQINHNRLGFIIVLVLVLEIMILMLLEKNQILILSKDIDFYERISLILIHFPVVGIGTSYIFYNTVKKNVYISEKYYKSSTEDFLTDSYNRRYLINYLEELQNECEISNEDFYLVFFDIDKFKVINDNYGHAIGDEVLKLFVNIAKSEIKEHDILGRFGGDEFILILRNISYENSIKILKRIQKKFLSKCKSKFNFNVTISAGVESSKGKSINDVIFFADKKMYREKTEKYIGIVTNN